MARAKTMAEYEQQMAEYTTNRDAAMAAAGVAIGDTVEYHHIGA